MHHPPTHPPIDAYHTYHIHSSLLENWTSWPPIHIAALMAFEAMSQKLHLNIAWRPCEVRWLFSRTILQWPYWGIFEAKPTHSHAVYPLAFIPTHLPLSHPFCSHWTNLPRTLLEFTSQIVWQIHAIAFKVGISGYGNLQTMSTDKWATSKSTQLSTKIWVKLLLLLENALKLNFEAL